MFATTSFPFPSSVMLQQFTESNTSRNQHYTLSQNYFSFFRWKVLVFPRLGAQHTSNNTKQPPRAATSRPRVNYGGSTLHHDTHWLQTLRWGKAAREDERRQGKTREEEWRRAYHGRGEDGPSPWSTHTRGRSCLATFYLHSALHFAVVWGCSSDSLQGEASSSSTKGMRSERWGLLSFDSRTVMKNWLWCIS